MDATLKEKGENSMAKKGLKITVGEHSAMFTKAEVLISDEYCSGVYNHPVILLTSDDDFIYEPANIRITFQRNIYPHDYSTPALGWTDTADRWTDCYAGKMDRKNDKIEIFYPATNEPPEDVLKRKLAQKITKTVEKYNLHAVAPHCELKRAVVALETLGLYVTKYYRQLPTDSHPGTRLDTQDGMGANYKAKKISK
jgi:hypothetical protein